MNLGHFCDPDRNHWEGSIARDMQWKIYYNEADFWPRHYACNGKEVINFGLANEEIVPCGCECHKKLK